MTVRVADRFGNPVAGVTVTFRAVGGMSVAEPTQVTTDALGHATSGLLTLGRQGNRAVFVEVAGKTAAWVYPALLPGPASRIEWWPTTATGPVPVYLVAGRSSGSLTVRVLDEFGLVVAGVPLTLCATPATAGVLRLATPGSPASTCVTSTAGQVDVMMESSGTIEPASIVASSPGLLAAALPVLLYG